MMAETLQELGELIANKLGPQVSGFTILFGELTVSASAAEIVSVLTFLRDGKDYLFTDYVIEERPAWAKPK